MRKMAKETPQTFGLLSERTPMQSYILTVYSRKRTHGYDFVRDAKAQSIDNLRKSIIGEFKGKDKLVEVERKGKNATRFIGTLELPSDPLMTPQWHIPGKKASSRVDPNTGGLI